MRSFERIEELRLALLEFKRTYNEPWMLEKYLSDRWAGPFSRKADLSSTAPWLDGGEGPC